MCFNLIGVYFCELILILCVDNFEGAQCAGVICELLFLHMAKIQLNFWRSVFPTVWSIKNTQFGRDTRQKFSSKFLKVGLSVIIIIHLFQTMYT